MCGGPEQFRSLVCTLGFLPARQEFFQPAAGRGSTAPAVRPGLGVTTSGGQADDELGACARAIAAADEPPLAPPPRSAPPFLECSSSLSQTVPPSTSLLPDGSLAPVLSEELSCDVPCWRSS